ncbi:MAG: DUF551 domain-containing protein [Bacteroidota bacterium]|nr:DUF551 domain-containing protein [Bacteroidota bacterium]
MTREESILWLNEELRTWENECQGKHPIKEALYVACKALEQEPCKALEQEPCEDAVSRTEVLNLVRFNAFHVKSQIKAIENMPSVIPQKLKWIPVSERLPNRKEYIANNGLFIVSDGNRTYAEYFDIYDSMKYFGEPTMSGFRVDRCVVAWMPLPESYRGDNNGK